MFPLLHSFGPYRVFGWELGPISLYSYGLLLALGYLAGLKLALIRARARGLNADRVMDLGIWIIVSALVGAKLLLLYQDWPRYSSDPKQLLSLAQSGGVFYGGLVLAVIVALWYIRRHKLPMWTTTDVFAPGIALGHVIGRLGCFLAGCCYGTTTTVPWGVVFTDPFAHENAGTTLGKALHPTQLYESGAEALILVGLLFFERRGRAFPGRTFWGYMLAYGVSRFVIELFRGDFGRGFYFKEYFRRLASMSGYFSDGISLSQIISIVLVPLSLGMLWWLSRRPAPTRDLAPARKVA
jgi:phosphatidylglycerol---prolipoprotein diacylglyceryl transferase